MNSKDVLRWSLVLFVALGSASALWAGCESCKWTDRGDRFEGVNSRQVSGGCCEILGVHYKRAGEVSAGAPRLRLFFWLPTPASPEIVVWQPTTNYMMVPKERRYLQGLQSFSWPRQDVIAPLGVGIDTLYTRVRDAREIYFPALLSTSERPAPAGSYVFVLESGAGIDAQCTIEREAGGKLTPIRSFDCGEEFGGRFEVQWDGRDDQGKPAAMGIYALRLKGLLEGEAIEDLNYTLHFQHYGRFE